MDIRPVQDIIAILISFVIAISIHECMHAWTAHKLGDNTARELGRITLNPLMHFEPVGFIGMVLIAIGYPFIGWGKPVPVVPGRFRVTFGGRRQIGMAITAAAGPLSNVAQAMIVAIPYQYAVRNNIDMGQVGDFLFWFIRINILLAAFNMIPIPPLDGHKILTGILPSFWYPVLAPLERYGFMILLLLFFIGGQLGGSLVNGMIDPVENLLIRVVFFGLV
ncbi:MAG TPA: site-2 protease family protein [Thermomicrobiales bacterium]|nr:site-2 protease family protein [Thermomicrobiales bacterium]